ncbi:hypothetical protein HY839_04785 [Candidatus Azambacteria bacterium]|nr:hypothetical protein [Candidatus Azambacteria bacterium]
MGETTPPQTQSGGTVEHTAPYSAVPPPLSEAAGEPAPMLIGDNVTPLVAASNPQQVADHAAVEETTVPSEGIDHTPTAVEPLPDSSHGDSGDPAAESMSGTASSEPCVDGASEIPPHEITLDDDPSESPPAETSAVPAGGEGHHDHHDELAELAEAANFAAGRARVHSAAAECAAQAAEKHMRSAASAGAKAANRAGVAEAAVERAEAARGKSVEAMGCAVHAAESVAADAKRIGALMLLAHASAEAADAHAQKAGVEASRAEDTRAEAEKIADELKRRKWTAWAWPLAFVAVCIAIFTLFISLLSSVGDVKVAVQEERGEHGATQQLAAQSSPAAPAPIPQAPAPNVQDQEPPLVPIPVPVQKAVPQAPVPVAVQSPAPVPTTVQTVVAPLPAPVVAAPVQVPAEQVAVPAVVPPAQQAAPATPPQAVPRLASEYEMCVSRLRAPPYNFALKHAREGCAFSYGAPR